MQYNKTVHKRKERKQTTNQQGGTRNMMYTMMNRPEMMLNHMIRDFCGVPSHGPHRRPMLGFPVDVQKTEDAYILTADVPGARLEDLAITVENDVLTIAADLKRVTREEREGYLVRERRGGHMERSFTLEGIDQNGITAACLDGVLTITLPKAAPAEGKGLRRIAINGAVPAIEAPAE